VEEGSSTRLERCNHEEKVEDEQWMMPPNWAYCLLDPVPGMEARRAAY